MRKSAISNQVEILPTVYKTFTWKKKGSRDCSIRLGRGDEGEFPAREAAIKDFQDYYQI